jgi:hypothetical protein
VQASNDLRTSIQALHRAIPDLARASTYGNPGLNLATLALDRVTEKNERSLACWMQRIIGVLREVTDVQDMRVTVDSNRLVRTLGALGDDFRRRREWRA